MVHDIFSVYSVFVYKVLISAAALSVHWLGFSITFRPIHLKGLWVPRLIFYTVWVFLYLE